jgi:prepilin-type N-terminal cleavage/methylation domain-containing protein
MKERSQGVERVRRGFTLIELLVVVAIIALLISILLPSLARARAQARTTLCGSRISQVAKAFLIYADDFGEAPPFVCYGRGKGIYYGPDPNENWLVSGLSGTTPIASILWNQEESLWPSNWAQTGMLFSYTRFEALYRCPEFERMTDPRNNQRKFNFSRCSLGRKARFDADHLGDTSDPLIPYGFAYDGPIMKPSMVFSTSRLPMVVDEAWDGYIGEYGTNDYTWDHCDPIMDIVDSFVGEYHSPAMPGVANVNDQWQLQYQRKRGSLAMYDGHVEFQRDWLPRVGGDNKGGGRPLIVPITEVVNAMKEMLGVVFHAQRGDPSPL